MGINELIERFSVLGVGEMLTIGISAMDQIPMHIFEIDGVQTNRCSKLCEIECKFYCLSAFFI